MTKAFLITLLLFSFVGYGQWELKTTPTTNSLYSIDCWDNNCLSAGIELIRSSDYGETWSLISFSGPSAMEMELSVYYGVKYIDASTIILGGKQVVNNTSIIIKSSDGGATWNIVHTGTPGSAEEIRNISFYNTMNGAAVGENGKAYITSDGGNSWTTVSTGSSNLLTDVIYLSSTKLIACGSHSIAISTTGGMSWTTDNYSGKYFRSIDNDPSSALKLTCFYTDGSESFIASSVDEGTTWIDIPVTSNNDLTHINENDTIYVGGWGGIDGSFNDAIDWFAYEDVDVDDIFTDFYKQDGVCLTTSEYTGNIYRYNYGLPSSIAPVNSILFSDTICPETENIFTSENGSLDAYFWYVDDILVGTGNPLYFDTPSADFMLKLVEEYEGHIDSIDQFISVVDPPTFTNFTHNIDSTLCVGDIIMFNVFSLLGPGTSNQVLYNDSIISPYSTSGYNALFYGIPVGVGDSITILKYKTNACDSLSQTNTIHLVVDPYVNLSHPSYSVDGIICNGDSAQIVFPEPYNGYTYSFFQDGSLISTITADSDTLFFNTEPIYYDTEITFDFESPNECLSSIDWTSVINIDSVIAILENDYLNFFVGDTVILDASNSFENISEWNLFTTAIDYFELAGDTAIYVLNDNGSFDFELICESENIGCKDTLRETINFFNKVTSPFNSNLCWTSSDSVPYVVDSKIDPFGNVYLAGYRDSGVEVWWGTVYHFVLQKYDPDGALIWEETNDIPYSSATSWWYGLEYQGCMFGNIEFDNEGNIYVTGTFTSPELHYQTFNWDGMDQPHPFIFKYNADGVLQWHVISIINHSSNSSGFCDLIVKDTLIYVSAYKVAEIEAPSGWHDINGPTGTSYMEILLFDLDGNYIKNLNRIGNNSMDSKYQPLYSYPGRSTHVSPQMYMVGDDLYLIGEYGNGPAYFGTEISTESHYSPTMTGRRSVYVGKIHLTNDTIAEWSAATKLCDYKQSNFLLASPSITSDSEGSIYCSFNWMEDYLEDEGHTKFSDTLLTKFNWASSLVKLDSDLNIQWKSVQDSSEICEISFSKNQNEIICLSRKQGKYRTFDDDIQPDFMIYDSITKNDNVLISKINPDGTIKSFLDIGEITEDKPTSLAVNDCGDYVVTGINYAPTSSWVEDSTAFYFDGSFVDYLGPSFVIKFTDTTCVSGGCTILCSDTSAFPAPSIYYNDGVVSTSSFYESYQWYFNDSLLTDSTDFELMISDTGSYYVEVYDLNGCHNVIFDTLYITCESLFDNPVIASTDSSLEVIDDYLSYQWYFNSELLTGENSWYIIPDSMGSYYCEVSFDNGCVLQSNELIPSCSLIHEAPIIYTAPTFIYTDSFYDTYQWYYSGAPLSWENNDTLYGGFNGPYFVEVSFEDGCLFVSNEIDYINYTFIDEDALFPEIYLHPNPFNSTLFLDFKGMDSEIIEIYDQQGKLLFQQKFSPYTESLTLELDFLSSGVYYLKFVGTDSDPIKIVKT